MAGEYGTRTMYPGPERFLSKAERAGKRREQKWTGSVGRAGRIAAERERKATAPPQLMTPVSGIRGTGLTKQTDIRTGRVTYRDVGGYVVPSGEARAREAEVKTRVQESRRAEATRQAEILRQTEAIAQQQLEQRKFFEKKRKEERERPFETAVQKTLAEVEAYRKQPSYKEYRLPIYAPSSLITKKPVVELPADIRGLGLGAASSLLGGMLFVKQLVSRPVETTKGVFRGIKEIGRRIVSGEGFPELVTIVKEEPSFAIGYVAAELGTDYLLGKGIAAAGEKVTILKDIKKFKAIDKIDNIEDLKNIKGLKGAKVSNEVLRIPNKAGTKDINIVIQRGGAVEFGEDIATQARRAGTQVDAISAARDLFNLFETKKIIRKPIPGEQAFTQATKNLLNRFDDGALDAEAIVRLNTRILTESKGKANLLERAFFADPSTRLRPSRLGIGPELDQGSLLNILSDGITFKRPKAQAVLFENIKIANFPDDLKDVARKLKANKPLDELEKARLLNWQVKPSELPKPLGYLSREPEITFAPKTILKRGEVAGTTLINGKKVTIFRGSVGKMSDELFDLSNKVKMGQIPAKTLKDILFKDEIIKYNKLIEKIVTGKKSGKTIKGVLSTDEYKTYLDLSKRIKLEEALGKTIKETLSKDEFKKYVKLLEKESGFSLSSQISNKVFVSPTALTTAGLRKLSYAPSKMVSPTISPTISPLISPQISPPVSFLGSSPLLKVSPISPISPIPSPISPIPSPISPIPSPFSPYPVSPFPSPLPYTPYPKYPTYPTYGPKITVPKIDFFKKKKEVPKKKPIRKVRRFPGESWDVYGKQIKTGKWIRLNKVGITREHGKSMGAKFIDETLSRSFKLRKRKGAPKPPVVKFPIGYFDRTSFKYRDWKKKGKKRILLKDMWIERTSGSRGTSPKGFLLDTLGERKKITLLQKLSAERKRSIGIVPKKPKVKIVKRISLIPKKPRKTKSVTPFKSKQRFIKGRNLFFR